MILKLKVSKSIMESVGRQTLDLPALDVFCLTKEPSSPHRKKSDTTD